MTEFIFFLLGLLLGSSVGITIMCCLQINRLNHTNSRKEVDDLEKKNS